MSYLNKTKLSVNINKLATIRNARGGNNPDLIVFAQKIESYGADGITIHPRPDQRHITFKDVYDLKKVVKTEFNIEGFPSPEFIKMVIEIKPEQVTLVPDKPEALTSNNGWDTKTHFSFLRDIINKLKKAEIRTSIFLNPDETLIESAKETGTDRIELYTEHYAKEFLTNRAIAIESYIKTAQKAHTFDLGVNAGHDLDLNNLQYFAQNIPNLDEVSIGHALICDALEYGMSNTIKMYLNQLY
ncbi:MAG: pyridoxine 5'-phosphate synthase [Bacteroidota bacterium]|nr:pyridoxine 5'-phosphate synthase [Bacteroidota bacterium]